MDTHTTNWKQTALPVGLIILTGAFIFLPFVSRLGFYRDDWYMLWSANLRGADSLIDVFSIDRPFMGYTYALIYRLLGNMPETWQIYAFILKTLSAIGVYGIVRLLWPEQRLAATAAALLFLFYPGFLGQPNAATKTNQMLSLTAELWSIWLSGRALTARRMSTRAASILAALLLGLLNYFLYEYMIGLEVLRMCVLWVVPQHTSPMDIRRRIRRFLADWWPYVAVILIFLIWRLFFFKSERGGVDQFSIAESVMENPRSALVNFGLESIMDALETVVLAWGFPFEVYATVEKSRQLATALFAGAAIVAIILLGLWLEQRTEGESTQEKGLEHAAWICLVGLVSLFGAMIPVLAAGRDVDFTGGFDKYTFHASPAVVILLVGFIFGFVRGRAKLVLLSILLFLGVTSTVLNYYHWERFWENEKKIWWQLWWRAPNLQDGTILLASLPEDGFFEDYEAWGPANLIYRPNTEMPTIGSEVINPNTIAKVRAGRIEQREMRGFNYARDYNHSLLLALPSDNSCLKVVDGLDINLPLRFEPNLVPILRYSYIDQVELSSPVGPPLEEMFGPEPVHDWCYYYQRAEQAKQANDWETIVNLSDEVFNLDLRPIDRAEWLPFLEGYIGAGDDSRVNDIAENIIDDPIATKEICNQLYTRTYRFGETIQRNLQMVLCER